tara:strand:- start:420 stop:1862 length:1443 start_codon:yes stop_codon:yes gene_type:complete
MNANLQYALNRLQGVSSNHFFLEPNNSSSAGPNSISRFSLPENTLWNTRETILHFNATTSGTDAGARLPPKIDSLVSSYRLSAGGVQLSSGNNLYNVLRHAKDALTKNHTESVLGHSEMVRAKSYVNNSAIATTANEVYTNNGSRRFAIKYWDGILGTIEPSIVDTSLFPSLTLEIVWAPVSVLCSVAGVTLPGRKVEGQANVTLGTNFDLAGNGAGSYAIDHMMLSVNVIGLASSFYDEMISARMASNSFLELPMKNYFMTENTHTGSTRFSVATQSLDRIIVCQRTTAFDTQKAPVTVTGHRKSGAFTSAIPIANTSTTATALNAANGVDVGVPQFDTGGIYGTSTEKYIPAFFNFKETLAGGTAAKYQFQLQGTLIPQAEAGTEEMYAISCSAMQGYHVEQEKTLQQVRDNYMVQAIRLNLPDSEIIREISGLDTRGLSMDGVYKATGLATTTNVVVFCECTSTIRLGNARSLEVVV